MKPEHLIESRTEIAGNPAVSLDDRIAATVADAVTRAIQPLLVRFERTLADRGPQLLTIPEFAKRVGRSVRSVERWIKDGTVDAVRVGEVWMVRLPAPR